MLCGLRYLPFFRILSLFSHFSLLLGGVSSWNVGWSRGRWPWYNGHRGGISHCMGGEQCEKVGHPFFRHHSFWNVRRFLTSTDLCSNKMVTGRCWRVFRIFLEKDFKIFILYLLSWFATWLFPFVVRGKRLLVEVKELGYK